MNRNEAIFITPSGEEVPAESYDGVSIESGVRKDVQEKNLKRTDELVEKIFTEEMTVEAAAEEIKREKRRLEDDIAFIEENAIDEKTDAVYVDELQKAIQTLEVSQGISSMGLDKYGRVLSIDLLGTKKISDAGERERTEKEIKEKMNTAIKIGMNFFINKEDLDPDKKLHLERGLKRLISESKEG